MLPYTTIRTISGVLLLLAVVVGLSGNPVYADSGNYPSSSCDGKIFPKYETAYAYYLRGNGCLEDERYTRAIEDYSRALELEPEYDLVFAQRGRAYFNQGDYELARADYEAYALLAGQMEPFMEEQLVVMQSPPPDVEEAETPVVTCDQTIESDIRDAQVYFNRGLACFEVGNCDQAVDDFLIAANLDEDYYITLLTHFTQFIDTNPTDSEAYIVRGRIYLMNDELDLALDDFNQALEFDPEHSRAYWGRGGVYAAQKKNDQAMAEFNRAIEIDPEYVYAYYMRGAVYGRIKDYELALADSNQAIALDPENPDVYILRSSIYASIGMSEDSDADCRKALQDAETVLDLVHTFDREAFAYQARGMAYMCLDNTSKAVADFRRYENITGYLTPAMQKYIAAVQNKSSTVPSLSITPSRPSFNPFPILGGLGLGWLIRQLFKKE